MVIYRKKSAFLALIFLLSMNITYAKFLKGLEISAGAKFELIHRHHLVRNLHNATQPISQLEQLKRLLQSDTIRFRETSRKIRLNHEFNNAKRRQVLENSAYYPACSNGGSSSSSGRRSRSSGKMPMHSGADYGAGQYFVQFKVGSPAQKLGLIADTGSDLTWMKCKYRPCNGERCGRDSTKRRLFRADDSYSFKTVACSSSLCKTELANVFSLAQCPSPIDPCAYDYRYSDGSSAVGLFATETVTFSLTNGRKARLHNMLVGCTESSGGASFEAADGVIGLGYSNYSFALKTAKRFGGKFSYCLVDHLSPKNISSYLVFGSHKEIASMPTRMQYTELVLGLIPPFYAVHIKGISIGGTMLEIPFEVWNAGGGGGVIVDSGSSLTFLTRPAYEPVMTALKLSVREFRRLNLDIGSLEYCFNSTGFDESLVPRLEFHFADGARFEPPVRSYVIDAAVGVKCLGFVAAAWPGACVIGNIIQQNHLWEYDIGNRRLGFGSSSCI